MKRFTVVLALFFSLSGSVAAATIDLSPQPGQFYIYLVNEPKDYNSMSNEDIKNLKLGFIPLLTVNDIISYNINTHEMKITEAAYNRFFQDIGVCFIVCVGEERIYGGTIWQDISSVSRHGVVISKPFGETNNTISIQLGYPSEEYFEGHDNRSDPRIINALKKAGKLVE